MMFVIVFELIHLSVIIAYSHILTKQLNKYKSVRELIKKEERMDAVIKKLKKADSKNSSKTFLPYQYLGK